MAAVESVTEVVVVFVIEAIGVQRALVGGRLVVKVATVVPSMRNT